MGGTLRTTGSGAQVEAIGQSSILDGTVTTLDNTGTVSIAGGATSLQIIGTIDNSGTFTISGGANLMIGTNGATLTGGSTVTLSAFSANTVSGEGASNFDNQNNTVSGSGSFVDMTLTNGGTIDANSASVPLLLRTAHTIANTGLLEAVAGTLTVSDSVTGTGTALIAAGGTMSFGASFQENLTYSGAGALILSQAYGGTISGFGSGDTIDLGNLPYKASYIPVWQSNGTLAIEDSANGNAIVATVAFSGNYVSGSFALSDDNNTTLIAGTGEVAPPSFPENPGNNDEWILSGGRWEASAGPGSHPSSYYVAGIGDWTGDGTDGILWFNASNGDTDEWQLNNGQWSASVDLGGHPGTGWTIPGVGDFFDNGRDDVLWTNASSGSVQTDIWELGSNGQWINSVSPGSHPAGYQVVGVGDFTGNGTSDILWYNASTGDADEWLINNGQWAGSVDLGTHPGNFQIVGVGHFISTATSDVLWHSPS